MHLLHSELWTLSWPVQNIPRRAPQGKSGGGFGSFPNRCSSWVTLVAASPAAYSTALIVCLGLSWGCEGVLHAAAPKHFDVSLETSSSLHKKKLWAVKGYLRVYSFRGLPHRCINLRHNHLVECTGCRVAGRAVWTCATTRWLSGLSADSSEETLQRPSSPLLQQNPTFSHKVEYMNSAESESAFCLRMTDAKMSCMHQNYILTFDQLRDWRWGATRWGC